MNNFDGELLNDFEDKYLHSKKRKCCCRLFIFLVIILIIISIIIILQFTVFKNKKEKEEIKKVDKSKEYFDELDTISNDEINEARNSFLQFNYIDEINKLKNLPYNISYNLFIPENYSTNKKYPLIIFIGDESTVGKEAQKVINKTIGGPIFATEKIQKKNECFVLVPQYKEVIIYEELGYMKNEYINITNRLIIKLKSEYNIDSNKIYCIGQSMGGNAVLYLLSNYQYLYTAGLIIDGFYETNQILELIKTNFTYIVFKESQKALNAQNEIKEYFDSLNINYGSVINVNYTENTGILNKLINNIYKKNYHYNFITFKSRTSNNETEEKNYFKYAYRSEAILDWIFWYNKVNCEAGYYYSENGKCISTTKKRVLLISRRNAGDILLNLLKKSSFIDVKIASSYINREMSESLLIPYDCIIYDFEDGGYWNIDSEIQEKIRRYIKNGGAFLVTHDHWDDKVGPLDLIGMERDTSFVAKDTYSNLTKVILNNHQIFDSYYDLTNWEIVNVSTTHQTYHKIKNSEDNTAKILMKFIVNNEIKYNYLVANEYKDGRLVYWAARHTKEISEKEEKLFINIVAWLTRYIQ